MKTFKHALAAFLTMLSASLITLPNRVLATDVCSSDAAQPVKDAAGCNGSSDNLVNTIAKILTSVILVLGTVAVIAIIIGGVQYMTSTGDAAKTKKAKDTILYAVIGLIICALAFLIVNFVVGIINQAQ